MSKRNLMSILGGIEITGRTGSADPLIEGLAYDSREVKKGYLFFALKGYHTDGHRYIDSAVQRGAAAIIHSDPLSSSNDDIVYLRVPNSRTVMAPVAAEFYGHPSERIKLVGITGTDGKSTTVSYTHQLMIKSGIKTGFLSTVQFDNGTGAVKNHFRQSTPEPTEIHRMLSEMVDNGCTHAVVEATSHGLSPVNNRLGNIRFKGAALTNISHEHLDFHKTLEQYIDDKANLFRFIQPDGFCVINLDDPNRFRFIEASRAPISFYSLKNPQGDMYTEQITETPMGQKFTICFNGERYPADLPQPGLFNIENILGALLIVHHLTSVPMEELVRSLPGLIPVKGRMNPVNLGQPFSLLVDYAHTPGSFEKLFPALRPLVKGKFLALFGSAGERDREKRPKLGEIASRYADIIILADEDPRGEIPGEVLEDIAAGCPGKKRGEDLIIIENRMDAIRRAFSMAREGDLVLLLGKGHESSIVYADGPMPWDETEAAISVLEEMGYRRQ